MTSPNRKRDPITLAVLGLIFALGYGFFGISFDQSTLSSSEAWSHGVAQPYVVSGVVLVALAFLFYRGRKWARWAILFWCPITILGGAAWATSRAVASFDSAFLAGASGIIAIWLWGVWRMFFSPSTSGRLHK